MRERPTIARPRHVDSKLCSSSREELFCEEDILDEIVGVHEAEWQVEISSSSHGL